MLEVMAKYPDCLITVEMRSHGMPCSRIAPLYEAAWTEGGGRPSRAGSVRPGTSCPLAAESALLSLAVLLCQRVDRPPLAFDDHVSAD